MGNLRVVKLGTIVIGFLTLVSAGIGLMNIMLVSVNERTREIGVTKSIGASFKTIFLQFISEAILICLIGGVVGIILGIALGNVVSIFLKTGFVFPVLWTSLGLFFCFLIGIIAGIYPAIRAGSLNPVEALRYE